MSLTTVTVSVLALSVCGCFADNEKSILTQTLSSKDVVLTCTLTGAAADPNNAQFFKSSDTSTAIAATGSNGITINNNALTIAEAKVNDNKGDWQCKGAGTDTTLSDKVTVGQATLTKTVLNTQGNEGNVELACDGATPWVFKKDGTVVAADVGTELVIDTNKITIKKDSIETHKGKYQCSGAVLSTLSEPVQVGSSAGKVVTSAIIIPLCMLVTSLM